MSTESKIQEDENSSNIHKERQLEILHNGKQLRIPVSSLTNSRSILNCNNESFVPIQLDSTNYGYRPVSPANLRHLRIALELQKYTALDVLPKIIIPTNFSTIILVQKLEGTLRGQSRTVSIQDINNNNPPRITLVSFQELAIFYELIGIGNYYDPANKHDMCLVDSIKPNAFDIKWRDLKKINLEKTTSRTAFNDDLWQMYFKGYWKEPFGNNLRDLTLAWDSQDILNILTNASYIHKEIFMEEFKNFQTNMNSNEKYCIADLKFTYFSKNSSSDENCHLNNDFTEEKSSK